MAKMSLAALSVHRYEENMKFEINMIPRMIHFQRLGGPPSLMLSHTLRLLNV
jgi:hypothetical protein